MVKVDAFLRSRKTDEIVQVTRVGAVVDYKNDYLDGYIRADCLEEQFEVLVGTPKNAGVYFAHVRACDVE